MTAVKTQAEQRQSTGLDGGMVVPLQPLSAEIWARKYQLRDHQGLVIDQDPDGMMQRVATALAALEKPEIRDHWQDRFLWALRNGAVPAGRILSNVGAEDLKPDASTINCTVSMEIPDSMAGIMDAAKEAALTLQAGSGIGYDFSTLRPKGAIVSGSGSASSGPLSFMDIFDRVCETVSAAGGRRGAQMAVMDIRHPDIRDFIRAKRADGRLRQFNLSVLVTSDFLAAVEQGADWPLIFPVTCAEWRSDLVSVDDPDIIWADWPGDDPDYQRNDQGHIACKRYDTVPARDLWNLVMQSTWEFAEPGFILIDQVNAENNCWFCEDIRATNPCGEQPLPPHGACLLGSINLTVLVQHAFSNKAAFDWQKFRDLVAVFTRLLDNVVDISGLPLPEQRAEIIDKRRHGMGFFGLGSALTMLGMRYGDKASLDFAEQVAREMALVGWRTGLDLAREKGMAPILARDHEVTASMLRQRPGLSKSGVKAGDKLRGLDLLMQYSVYFQRLAAHLSGDELQAMQQHGLRFTHHSSIAPTGTISLSLGNNASNGIEPSFAHHYRRNILTPGKKSKQQQDVWSYEALVWQALKTTDDQMPDYAATSLDIAAEDHLAMQAAVQPWIDSAISKTVNIPASASFGAFQQLYKDAAALGLKGCTTYRPNPKAYSGVLVDPKIQADTVYVFTLEDGREIRAHGDEDIEYEGEMHKAANLFEALKDGYYGKM